MGVAGERVQVHPHLGEHVCSICMSGMLACLLLVEMELRMRLPTTHMEPTP